MVVVMCWVFSGVGWFLLVWWWKMWFSLNRCMWFSWWVVLCFSVVIRFGSSDGCIMVSLVDSGLVSGISVLVSCYCVSRLVLMKV